MKLIQCECEPLPCLDAFQGAARSRLRLRCVLALFRAHHGALEGSFAIEPEVDGQIEIGRRPNYGEDDVVPAAR